MAKHSAWPHRTCLTVTKLILMLLLNMNREWPVSNRLIMLLRMRGSRPTAYVWFAGLVHNGARVSYVVLNQTYLATGDYYYYYYYHHHHHHYHCWNRSVSTVSSSTCGMVFISLNWEPRVPSRWRMTSGGWSPCASISHSRCQVTHGWYCTKFNYFRTADDSRAELTDSEL